MYDVECPGCSHRFRPPAESGLVCPGCGSSGPFRIPCWRCKRSLSVYDLSCITCDACQVFWVVVGCPDPRRKRPGSFRG